MSIINPTASDVLTEYRLKTDAQEKKNELGQNEFMELLVAQLNNQSPLEPQSDTEWIAQLAQFSSVESLDSLNETVDGIATDYRSSQALQASAMVGRDVLVEGNTAARAADQAVIGMIDLPNSTADLTLSVFNNAGELVRRQSLGTQRSGDVPFKWDGTNDRGEMMPAGEYRFVAEGRFSGERTAVPTYLTDTVSSVSIDARGDVALNLAGRGTVGMGDVKEIF